MKNALNTIAISTILGLSSQVGTAAENTKNDVYLAVFGPQKLFQINKKDVPPGLPCKIVNGKLVYIAEDRKVMPATDDFWDIDYEVEERLKNAKNCKKPL